MKALIEKLEWYNKNFDINRYKQTSYQHKEELLHLANVEIILNEIKEHKSILLNEQSNINLLANFYHNLGIYNIYILRKENTAIEMLEKALKYLTKLDKTEDDKIKVKQQLAYCYFIAANSKRANEYINEVSEFYATHKIGNEFDIAFISKLRADVKTYWEGDYINAEKLYLSALDIYANNNNAEKAYTLHNLATLLSKQKRYDEAINYYQQAILLREQLFDVNHPEVAMTICGFGDIFFAANEYTLAKWTYLIALSMKSSLYQNKIHPSLAFTIKDIARVYHAEKDYPTAEELYKLAIKMQTLCYEGENKKPIVSKTKYYLSVLYYDWKKYHRANEIIDEVYEMQTTYYPIKDHPDMTETLSLKKLILCAEKFKETFFTQSGSMPSNQQGINNHKLIQTFNFLIDKFGKNIQIKLDLPIKINEKINLEILELNRICAEGVRNRYRCTES